MKSNIPKWMLDEVAEYDLDFVTPPRTVLDIGANIGAFTLRCLERWPGVCIRAYEPVHPTFDQLVANVPKAANISTWHAAVRNFSGEADILIGDRPVTCGFHNLGRQTLVKQRVACFNAARLDSADLVKIDTEGCEVEILRAMHLEKTKAVVVEYHRPEDLVIISDLLEGQGFERAEHIDKDGWGILKYARPGVLRGTDTARGDARPTARPTKKLFVALPVYGALDVFFTQSLLKLVSDPPLPIAVRMCPGDSLVARARNTLTADFLASDCTHLLFIDTDLIFGVDQIRRIMQHKEPIVGGSYPKKQEGPLNWVCNGCLEPREIRADGLQEVRYMGTGFLRIAREVFERMIEAQPELAFKPDHRDRIEHDFWSVGVYRQPSHQPGRYLSEDWFFCQRALDLGYQVWGDTKIVLKHVGQAIYPLRTQQSEMLAPCAPSPEPSSDASAPVNESVPCPT